ncbi:MAG: MarR family transcriptional regulator [Planctomycetota bacterium]
MGGSLREELGKRGDFESVEQEAYLSVLRTAAMLSVDFRRLFRAHGLTEASYNVLRIIRGSGKAGRAMGDIAPDLVAPGPDVTRIVDRLETKGLVERWLDEDDQRVVRVGVTAVGARRLRTLDGPVLELHRRQLGDVPVAELRRLCRLLERARASGAAPRET